MKRFVIGLLVLALGWYGWQWYAATDVGAKAERDLFEAAGAAGRGESGPEKIEARALEAQQGPESGGQQGEQPGDRLLAGLQGDEPEALAAGFGVLRAATQPRRGRLAGALAGAWRRAASLKARVAVLGRGNAFLHSEEGRALARKAVEKVCELPREQAVLRLSALLVRCLQGPLRKPDVAAHEFVNETYERHRVLVERVVFDPSSKAKARSYKVKPGDSLDRIAARYRKQGIAVEGWTLCYVNRIGRPNRLQAGKTIRIPTEPIWARVEKASFSMAVFLGDVLVRLYWIGHGKDDLTPETTFTVGAKLADPDWFAPDGNVYPFGHPKNVLGRYFVKFNHPEKHGFGAHGTAEPETVRTASSLGCIRMHDADIEEFFRFVPRRARVVIAAGR